MKKLSTFIICVSAFVFQSQAQTIVGTTPENKNAVLEEFTGIHCVYCPQGHLIAHDILVAHPNDACIIAVHQGSFATPNAGEPNYKTIWGDALWNQSGGTGYPAATVSRHVFTGHEMTAGGTAEGRNYWSQDASTIISQPSYVNVGVTANVDYATREITIHCEAYYTANSTVANNYLNIALTQNNIKGPQTGSGSNPTMVTPDGLYLHQHMLRYMFTGQWGQGISNTNSATGILKVDTTFTYTIPSSYTNIPVSIPDLQVVAFITESHQEIITGSSCTVNAPPDDCGISTISNVASLSCSNTIAPSVTLKNFGLNTLTSTTIYYKIDAGTLDSIPWTGTLVSGTTTSVVLPTITVTSGSHILYVYSGNINGGIDQNSTNDQSQQSFSSFSSNIPISVTENFSSSTFPPVNWASIDGGDALNWARLTATHTAPAGSAYLNFYSIASGQLDYLVLNPVTLAGISNTTLSFYMAHRQYSATYTDRLDVEVSTNCGTTWTSKWNKSGAALATGAITTSSFVSPLAAEWRLETIDLSAYDGQSDVMIRFKGTSGYGNNVIIDDINLHSSTSINENQEDLNSVSVFPNPFQDNCTISLSLKGPEVVSYNLVNLVGEVIYSENFGTLNSGIHELFLDTPKLSNGIYYINLFVGNSNITKKVTVIK